MVKRHYTAIHQYLYFLSKQLSPLTGAFAFKRLLVYLRMLDKVLFKLTGLQVAKEHLFCDGRRWRFDYALPTLKIAIEIEGGVFTNGRHTRGKGYLNDMEKYNMAAELGWTLLRYTPTQLNESKTYEQIQRVIKTKQQCQIQK